MCPLGWVGNFEQLDYCIIHMLGNMGLVSSVMHSTFPATKIIFTLVTFDTSE
ncbi:MAG TPA: hypothetical protein VGD04_08840 [Methylophilus sp.]